MKYSLFFLLMISFASCTYVTKESDNEIQEALEQENFDQLTRILHTRNIKDLPYHYTLENKDSALHLGVRQNSRSLILLLLKSGENLNSQNILGNTPLIDAVVQGNCESVETLIVKGADPNIKNEDGHTALIEAVIHQQCLEVLLINKVNPRFKDESGLSALSYAHAMKDQQSLNLLKKYGAL